MDEEIITPGSFRDLSRNLSGILQVSVYFSPRIVPGSFRNLSWIFQRIFHGSFIDLSGLFQRSFRYLSGTFQGSFRDNSGRSRGSFMDLSGIFQSVIFQGSFKDLSGIFQRSFKDISGLFQYLSGIVKGSFRNLYLSLSISPMDLSGIFQESFSISFYFSPNIFECRISISILKVKKKNFTLFSSWLHSKIRSTVDIYFNLSWSLVTASYLSFVSYFIFIFSLSSPKSLSVCLSRGQSLFFYSLDFNLWRSYSIFTVYSCLIPGKNLKKIQIFERKNCFHVWS